MTKARYARYVVIAALLIFVCSPAGAQATRVVTGFTAATPGSDLDEYLRYLQTTGAVAPAPWSVRELSSLRTLNLAPSRSTPWQARFASRQEVKRYWFLEWTGFPVNAKAQINSGFPFGINDGAVWAGRGATLSADFGGMLRAGPIILQLNPVLFWAQNAAFPLLNNGQKGLGIYRTGQPLLAAGIDLPQRFGDQSYSRVDLGESELRFETPWVMGGVSNAHRLWGPASTFPFVLGRNAAGFEHLFLSTNQPLNLWFAKMTANLLYGRLSQSRYSPVTGSAEYFSIGEPGRKRFATGIVVAFQPRGATGLEFGVSRFYQSLWPRSGIPRSYFTKPFQNFLKRSLEEKNARLASDTEGSDNQLLSVFARWVLPRSGAEFYMEYGREDHSYDFRDLVNEPDHSRSYLLGARKVMHQDAQTMSAVRAEIINYQLPTIARHRDEGGIYVHTLLRQGHTNRGQMLGAPLGPGASAGLVLAYDRFAPNGRYSVTYMRTVNQEAGRFFVSGVTNPSAIDVTHSLGVERLLFRGPIDLTLGATVAREFNRNFAGDAFNFSAVAGVRYNLP